jgi:hypothetical protein
MEYQDESMPLNPSVNVILTQNRLQVRGNMRQTLDRTLQTSYFLVTFKLTLTISKVIPTQMLASAFIITFHKTKVDQPLLLWVLLSFMMDMAYLALIVAKLPYIKRLRDGEQVEEPCWLKLFFNALNVTYVVWLLPGNIWFYRCKDCFSDAPALTALMFALLILGYLYLAVPALLIACICACLPVSIIFLMFISNENHQPATEDMLNKLCTEKYDPDTHKGDLTCSICAVEYAKDEPIIVLKCDSR